MLLLTTFASFLLFRPILATGRTSPPSGSLTVGSSGTYNTISTAVAATEAGASIFVYFGTYNEAVYITVSDITIYGETTECVTRSILITALSLKSTRITIISTSSYTSNTVTITHGSSAATSGSDDASGTLRVHANSFKMYNINVVNSYGIGSQALALSAYGTEQVRCFLSRLIMVQR